MNKSETDSRSSKRPARSGRGRGRPERQKNFRKYMRRLRRWVRNFFVEPEPVYKVLMSNGEVQKRRKKPQKRWVSSLILPAALFYEEIVFNLSTVGTLSFGRVLMILLFSVSIGCLFSYLCGFSAKPQRNRNIRTLLMAAGAVFFTVWYFSYRHFLTLNGPGSAGSADVSYDDMAKLIFSGSGLLHILLFFIPFLSYWILGPKFDKARKATALHRVHLAVMILLTYGLSMAAVYGGGYGKAYSSGYEFQTAVGDFGLMTGIRKEIMIGLHMIEPGTGSDTQTADAGSESVMDIDFASLAKEDTGLYKVLDTWCASQTPSKKNEYTGYFKGKNLIFITAEAFSSELIIEDLTPTLYRLANKGIQFQDYYQPSSAGAVGGEYENLFGLMPTDGTSSMDDIVDYNNYFTMGSQLNRLGYWGKAYHNSEGTNYNRDKTHNALGYSEGFMAMGSGMEQYVTQQWPESDLEMIKGTLPEYIDQEHFNVYYMTISGHSSYTPDGNAMTIKNWNRVADLDCSDTVKSYIACNLELEDAMSYLVSQLEEKGIADDTVIVLSSDSYPYGLDSTSAPGEMTNLSELYGYDVENYLQRDHSRLIIWSGCLEDRDPIAVDKPTSSLDIVPTLSNLFGTEWDSRLFPGRDVFSDADPLVFNMNYDWKTDKGTYIASTQTFTATNASEAIPDDYVRNINRLVHAKIDYCTNVLRSDYFGHLFGGGSKETQESAAAAEVETETVKTRTEEEMAADQTETETESETETETETGTESASESETQDE